MSSKLKPAIWSHDTGQRIPCFDKYTRQRQGRWWQCHTTW